MQCGILKADKCSTTGKEFTIMHTPPANPEQRVKRGCNFIILLLAILGGINLSAAGIQNTATQIFLGLLVFAVVVRIAVAREPASPPTDDQTPRT